MRIPSDLPFHLLLGTALLVLARLYWRFRRTCVVPSEGLRRGGFVSRLAGAMSAAGWGVVAANTIHPSWFRWSELPLPYLVRAIAVPAVIVTVVMLSWTLTEAAPCYGFQEKPLLVTTGVYAVVRHPLYVATCAALASMTLLSASWVMAALTLGTSIELLAIRAPREDRALHAHFGAVFERYRAEVPAFLRIRSGAPTSRSHHG